jgi:hypothetical protein
VCFIPQLKLVIFCRKRSTVEHGLHGSASGTEFALRNAIVSSQLKASHGTKETVAMSLTMDDSVKRLTAQQKTALVVEII